MVVKRCSEGAFSLPSVLDVIHHTHHDLVTEPVPSAGHDMGVLVLLVQCKVANSSYKLGKGLGHVEREHPPPLRYCQF